MQQITGFLCIILRDKCSHCLQMFIDIMEHGSRILLFLLELLVILLLHEVVLFGQFQLTLLLSGFLCAFGIEHDHNIQIKQSNCRNQERQGPVSMR